MKVNWIRKYRWVIILSVLMSFSISIMACNSDHDSGDTGGAESLGNLAISLTDAEGDFLAYTVDVTSLTLRKANGAVVSVLPESTRIDFTQYVDFSEFLTVASLPIGVYTEAQMTLDYSNADIWVENAAGENVEVGAVTDNAGNPLSEVTMTVQLEGRKRLAITLGVISHLQLDFDLNVTNLVSFDQDGSATVEVDPYLVAEVNRTVSKIHKIRGLLASVDQPDGSFEVTIRPFYYALTGSHDLIGKMTVTTDTETVYDIDNETFQGEDGLMALAALDTLSAVVVAGEVLFNPLRFKAEQVYAGESVPWGTQDIITGSVISRNADTIRVKGATLVRQNGSVVFNDVVTVNLGKDTVVTKQLSLADLSIDDISIGQRIAAFGSLTEDSPTNIVLDATGGQVNLQMTVIRGNVNNVNTSDPDAQLLLDLQSINQHRIGVFDFSGTGKTSEQDADPADFEVGTGSFDLGTVGPDDPVKIRGFVQPFGGAPQDFNAVSVINVADVPTFLKVYWFPASEHAFDSCTADGLVLNLTGVGLFHHVFQAGVATDLTELGVQLQVVPQADGRGLFILRVGGVVQVFTAIEDYIEEVNALLDSTHSVRKTIAWGLLDNDTSTLTATLIDILII